MRAVLFKILSSKLFYYLCLASSLAFLSYHAYSHEWIDSALLMSRIVFVFILLASFKSFPLHYTLPVAIFAGPLFDRLLDYSEDSLMEFVRIFLGNVVNPQFILIGITIAIFIYILGFFVWKRSLRFLFLAVLLIANIGASSLFHYTQVDQFIKLENQRMISQADLLYGNLMTSGFENIPKICSYHQLKCVYGESKEPVDGIDPDFHSMFQQAIDSEEPAYRTMRKFDETEADPTKASMYQIFMFSHGKKWFYFSDQDKISPYYFNARRNFSILYTAFSFVWMLIAAFILYRHSGFIDKKVRLKKGINQ